MGNEQANLEAVSARLAKLERSNWRAQRFVVARRDGTQADGFGLQPNGPNNLTMGVQSPQSEDWLSGSQGGVTLFDNSRSEFGAVALTPAGFKARRAPVQPRAAVQARAAAVRAGRGQRRGLHSPRVIVNAIPPRAGTRGCRAASPATGSSPQPPKLESPVSAGMTRGTPSPCGW